MMQCCFFLNLDQIHFFIIFLLKKTFLLGLNTFLVLIFVMFVVDGPHFDRMFKMILIFIECLK